MSCECEECAEYGGPDPRIMAFRLSVFFAQAAVGLYGMLKERSFKALLAWLGGLALFFTVPRYMICARCGGYGQNCYSLYCGKITSMYMPKVEGHEHEAPSPLAMFLEVVSLATVSNAPAVGMRKNKKLLALYMLLATITLWGQFLHACRHCSRYGKEWKKECPSARTYRRMFGEA